MNSDDRIYLQKYHYSIPDTPFLINKPYIKMKNHYEGEQTSRKSDKVKAQHVMGTYKVF